MQMCSKKRNKEEATRAGETWRQMWVMLEEETTELGDELWDDS